MEKEVLIERVKERLRGDVIFERVKKMIGEQAVDRIIREEIEDFLGDVLRNRVRELIKEQEVGVYKERVGEVLEDLFNFLNEWWEKVIFRKEGGEWLGSGEGAGLGKEIYGVIDIKLKQIFITTKCFENMYGRGYRHILKILESVLRKGKKGFTTTKRIKLRDEVGERSRIVSGYLIEMMRLRRLNEKVLENIKEKIEEIYRKLCSKCITQIN